MSSSNGILKLVFLVLLSAVVGLIALPKELPIEVEFFGNSYAYTLIRPSLDLTRIGIPFSRSLDLQFGLDIQGGTRITLDADMSAVAELDRQSALESAREIVNRRVDLFGVSEAAVRTSVVGEQYRVAVELPGVTDVQQAISTIGTTAQLLFRIEKTPEAAQAAVEAFQAELENSPELQQQLQNPQLKAYVEFLQQFDDTELTGKDLARATVQFDPNTREPVVSLEFSQRGKELFSELTTEAVGRRIAIFLDDQLVSAPVVNTPITDGNAVITGGFDIETAKQLVIQLNAGALPVPLAVVEQETIEASIGQESVERTAIAGGVGLVLIVVFMILMYGWAGFLAVIALVLYSLIMVAIFKLWPVTLTMPGIAGLLLSVGMAVDANVLIFERMKEEIRAGRSFSKAMELGFGKAWDAIREANIATLFICFILFNPFDFEFLNRSGPVRGFALTLALGVFVSIFTGVFVTRTLLRLFLRPESSGGKHG